MSDQARTEMSSRPPIAPTPRCSVGTKSLDFPVRKKTNLMCVRLWMATTSSATGQSVPIVTSSSNGSGTTVTVDLEIVKKSKTTKKNS